MNKLFKQKYLLLFIISLAFFMRVTVINQSLWLDEAIGVIAARDYSYFGIINEFIKADNHTPLYYWVLKMWTGVFGYSEASIRFPSIVFGVLTVYLVYRVAKLINTPKTTYFPEIAALLIATSSFHIYYSQEARMYSLAAFLASLAFYFFILLLGDKGRNIKYWIIYSVSLTLLLFSDYVPVFLLPVFPIISLLKKKNLMFWRMLIFSHVPLFILGILWLPILLLQSQNYGQILTAWPQWQLVAGGATFKQAILVWMKFVFGRISLVNKLSYYLLVFFASIPTFLTVIYAWKKKNDVIENIFLWLSLPLILGFLVSFWFPAFIYFRFLFVVPAFYLLIAWGLSSIGSAKIRNITLSLIIFFNVLSWMIYVTDYNQKREQWKQATAFVESRVNDSEIVIFEFPEPFAPYRWYSENPDIAHGVTDSVSVNKTKTQEIVIKKVGGKKSLYYFEYLQGLSDPDDVVRNTLRDLGFREKEIFDFPGVGLIYYYSI